ncbi:RNA polymerase sigma factor SigJ [Actinomadura barringtoniae]|uniref:RNA polymerase sigma factor SigJ n=1 Tax=Actinomadura barringtoniae TaxID=1427535 RepID=A0A939PM73_9ACTN|nr:RNA polymerase sigma factor SigJ [Actinomadura barringtoniae]MBO2452459.1 RNA polymerase sigma factor SigJ [Actinomadura barringtoniae]
MVEQDELAARFEEHRSHLRAVAYRILGSVSEAEDAVQEAWFRLVRSDADEIDNLGGWLTTVVGRLCLDQLRSRESRREDPYGEYERIPDPIVGRMDAIDPEQEVMLADQVGLALMVVLETLNPAERLAFVLHDMFSLSFEEIAPIVDRTPAATRQLASRARRRVQGSPAPDTDTERQRTVIEAFMAAARGGDFEALVSLLDPDVVLRADVGGLALQITRGAAEVAGKAMMFQRFAASTHAIMINGLPGSVTAPGGKPSAVMSLTLRDGKIVGIDIIADLTRLDTLDIPVD